RCSSRCSRPKRGPSPAAWRCPKGPATASPGPTARAMPTPSRHEARERPPMTEQFLRNIWYFALPSTALRRGRMTARRLLGEPLLFGRAADGTPFALRDVCPHRGIPLSYGRFDGAEIECCYHGWRFDTGGRCTAIPSLVE